MLHAAWFLLLASMTGMPAQDYGTTPVIGIAIRAYAPEGTLGGSVVSMSRPDAVGGFLWASSDLCQLGFSPKVMGSGTAWLASGRLLRRANNGWIASIQWQRVAEGGRLIANAPVTSKEIEIQPDEFVALERLIPDGDGGCKIREGWLEVTLQPRIERRGGGGAIGASAFNAELWLVHRLPDGTETSTPFLIRGETGTFSFTPIPIVMPQGKLLLTITGWVRSAISQLTVSVNRVVSLDGATPLVRGGTTKNLDWPKPDDVISLELPPARENGRDLLAGHLFSLRLRVSPAK